MYEISKHAKERYSERIMDKDSKVDVNRFVIENDEKIKTDINKMIEYGEMIFEGKPNRDRKNKICVYLKDCWVVLCDPSKSIVITLYKVDLGLEDEFNKLYIEKMLDKLTQSKGHLEITKQQLQEESQNYSEIIENNISQINEYKGYIKNLEELNNSYKNIIENNSVQIDIAEKEVVQVVNDLIGKKEF